jgi:hypothetical protein
VRSHSNIKALICLAILAVAFIAGLSCRKKYEIHGLKRVSVPFQVEGVKVRPEFSPSPLNQLGFYGPPWHMYVTSETSSDGRGLVLSSARITGNGIDVELIDKEERKEIPYKTMADDSKWLQTMPKKSFDAKLDEGAVINLNLQGEIHLKDKVIPFDQNFEFKSETSTGEANINPILE